MRIFFDTNVLVAAFATRGLCADLLRLVLLEHRLVVTPTVHRELARVLAEKIGLPTEKIVAIRHFLEPFTVDAEVTSEGPKISLRDPSDEAVVASAIAARAELIVSGDGDLIDAELPLPVVAPRGLWERLRGQG